MRMVSRIVFSFVLVGLIGCDGRSGTDVGQPVVDAEPPTEVAAPPVAVSAEKMNVFYIGVENPLLVSAGGAAGELRVTVSGGGSGIRSAGAGRYLVTVSQPGTCVVTVRGTGLSGGKQFQFRCKRIPDPVARLSKSQGGSMGSGEFKAQGGVGAYLPDFDFDAGCAITGFDLTYVARRQDPVTVTNAGARFNEQSTRLISRAKPGDIYFFANVRAKCPGDEASRPINTMVFTIR